MAAMNPYISQSGFADDQKIRRYFVFLLCFCTFTFTTKKTQKRTDIFPDAAIERRAVSLEFQRRLLSVSVRASNGRSPTRIREPWC